MINTWTKIGVLCCFLLALGGLPAGAHAIGGEPRVEIDWPAFMEKQDLVWEVLPEHWYESAFLGDGMLGLMLYREPGKNYLRIETGNSMVHDHRPGGGLFDNPRLLTGHFALYPEGEIVSGTMRLDLWNAEATARIVTTRGFMELRAWVQATDQVMMVQVKTAPGERNFRWEWVPAKADSPRYLYGQMPEGSWMQLPSHYESNPDPIVNPGLSVQKLLAGGETAVAWQEERLSADERRYWMTVTHSYPSETASTEAVQLLCRAQEQGFERLLQKHRSWWHSYYPASFLSVSDGQKENFYWAQLYKLASATRAHRALIDNTGPWLTVTPWPNAWWNLNVQLTYWPLLASNHLDLAGSLEKALYGHVDQLRLNVPAAYRDSSLAIGRSSNLSCETTPVGCPGQDEGAEVGLLPWACHNLWLTYRHKMDDEQLRTQLFPLLKQAIQYYLHFLYKGEDGKLHLPRTYSPEYGSAEDANFDLALLRWGCQTLLAIVDRLNLTEASVPRWKEVLSDLTPYPVDAEGGLMIGRGVPYASSHRHYSHLLAAYPLYLLNRENPADVALIAKSLAHWQSKPEALRGYSFTGASSLAAALGKGDEALEYLDKLFDEYLSANTLYRESGPVIETPLSAAKSMQDMLLQSWGGKIRVFPAVPAAWPDVVLKDFRTEGAFLVTASRSGGKTDFLTVRSLAGEPCILVTDLEQPVFRGNREHRVVKLAEQTYQVDLRKGEVIWVYAQGTKPDWTIRPVVTSVKHTYGVKQSRK